MLEISWSEILILAVVTLLFVGPKELPVFLRTIGRYAGMARRQAAEFKAQFDAAMREAEFSQMKEELDKVQTSVNAEVTAAEKSFKDAEQASKFDPTSITTLTPGPKPVAKAADSGTPSEMGEAAASGEPAGVDAPQTAAAENILPPAPAPAASFEPSKAES